MNTEFVVNPSGVGWVERDERAAQAHAASHGSDHAHALFVGAGRFELPTSSPPDDSPTGPGGPEPDKTA